MVIAIEREETIINVISIQIQLLINYSIDIILYCKNDVLCEPSEPDPLLADCADWSFIIFILYYIQSSDLTNHTQIMIYDIVFKNTIRNTTNRRKRKIST